MSRQRKRRTAQTKVTPRYFDVPSYGTVWLTAGLWLLLGGGIVHSLAKTPIPDIDYKYTALTWFAGLWLMAIINLFLLAKVVARLLYLMSDSAKENKAIMTPIFGAWMVAKLLFLGFFGWVFMNYVRTIPPIALFLGLGTLVVVPLGGGLIWSLRAAKNLEN